MRRELDNMTSCCREEAAERRVAADGEKHRLTAQLVKNKRVVKRAENLVQEFGVMTGQNCGTLGKGLDELCAAIRESKTPETGLGRSRRKDDGHAGLG